MANLKKEIYTIIILAVMAITGIYVANAAPFVSPAYFSTNIQSAHCPLESERGIPEP